jgi:hypothetical protein
MDYQGLKEIASRSVKDRRELLAALSGVAEIRRELDEIERDLLKDARDAGASWAAIATALSLASRQAAEQRWLRLQGVRGRDPGRARSQRAQRNEDDGPGLEELAKAADAAHRELRARAPGSAKEKLAAATLRQARDAPSGALYDLVRQALADLDADEGSAVVELRRALDTADPALKD